MYKVLYCIFIGGILSCSFNSEKEQTMTKSSLIESFLSETYIYTKSDSEKYSADEIKKCLVKASDKFRKYRCGKSSPVLSVRFFADNYFYIIREITKLERPKAFKQFYPNRSKFYYSKEARYLFKINGIHDIDLSLKDPLKEVFSTKLILNLLKKKFPKKEITMANLRWSEQGYYKTFMNDDGHILISTTFVEDDEHSIQVIGKVVYEKGTLRVEEIESAKQKNV